MKLLFLIYPTVDIPYSFLISSPNLSQFLSRIFPFQTFHSTSQARVFTSARRFSKVKTLTCEVAFYSDLFWGMRGEGAYISSATNM